MIWWSKLLQRLDEILSHFFEIIWFVVSTMAEPSPRSATQKAGEVFLPTPVLSPIRPLWAPPSHTVGICPCVLHFPSLYLQVVMLSVLLESFQEFLCRDDFIPASLRSQHFTCKDMMKEAWLLCFDEFQVTHISSSCFEALEVLKRCKRDLHSRMQRDVTASFGLPGFQKHALFPGKTKILQAKGEG